jgi:signal transduction histidine kinase
MRQVCGDDPLVALEAPDEALLRGDEDLMRIAVENLLGNAKKFRRPGGGVLVTVESSSRGIRLTITNQGVGIPEADRSRIFERFYRGSAARADSWGHGLGLPLSRHIARLHGGEVECVSREDEDARFVLEVPAWRSTALPEPSRVPFSVR